MTIKFMTKICSVAIMILFVIIALGPGIGHPGLGLVSNSITSLATSGLPLLSASPGPVLSYGAPRPVGHSWRACRFLRLITTLILWLHHVGQRGRWQRFCLLSYSSDYRIGY